MNEVPAVARGVISLNSAHKRNLQLVNTSSLDQNTMNAIKLHSAAYAS